MSEAEQAEMKTARVNALKSMKDKMKTGGKIGSAKEQKDFMNSILADNDDEVDLDPETADSLVETQKAYAEELRKKFKRKKKGTTAAGDEDFEKPTKEEVNDLMAQTLKLRKQRKLAKQNAEDLAELECDNCTDNATNSTTAAGAKKVLTAAEKKAKKAKRDKDRAAKKEEMQMMKDL